MTYIKNDVGPLAIGNALVDLSSAKKDAILKKWNENEAGSFDRAMVDFRNRRDKLLSNSDWTQLPDVSLSETVLNQWKTYRQDLRDLTNGLSTIENINSVTWPEAP